MKHNYLRTGLDLVQQTQHNRFELLTTYSNDFGTDPLLNTFRKSFRSVTESMGCMGFTNEDINGVMTVLAIILHIGDIVRSASDKL